MNRLIYSVAFNKIAASMRKKSAVIIKGNSKYIKASKLSHMERPFYSKLKRILESEGYTVSFDPGRPYTQPKAADVWVGFSRGCGRLRFAPGSTITIPIGSSVRNSINNPVDAAWQRKHKNLDMLNIPEKDRPPIPKEHLMITPSMEREIRRRLQDSMQKTAAAILIGGGLFAMKKYREGGAFTHDGIKYDLDKALAISESKRTQNISIKKLEWVLKHDTPKPARLRSANINVPVLVAPDRMGRPTVIDGLHRLAKAKSAGKTTIPAKVLTRADLREIRS